MEEIRIRGARENNLKNLDLDIPRAKLVAALRAALEQEREITVKFNEIVGAFLDEKDHSTVNFLQWFVAEQHEEESLFRALIAKAELIGDEPRGQFWLDRELAEAAKAERAEA